MPYRRLNAGEIIQEGDEVDASADGWRDEPEWKPTNNIGQPAPDPAFPAHRQYRRLELTDYAETMDRLKDPEGWDIPGIIADAAERVRVSTDEGSVLAVIDTLVFRIREIREIARGDKHAFPSDRCKTIELMCDALVTSTLVNR